MRQLKPLERYSRSNWREDGLFASMFGRLAQLVRALALQARGRRFESYIAHQTSSVVHYDGCNNVRGCFNELGTFGLVGPVSRLKTANKGDVIDSYR